MLSNILGSLAPWAPLMLRIALGVAFIAHGRLKVFGETAESKMKTLKDIGMPPTATVLTGVVQVVGGAALIAGFLTQLVGMVMAVMMIVTTVVSKQRLHLKYLRGYELDLAYLVGALTLAFLGGGEFSLDALLGI
ncbi:MAG: DoxX family protein [Thaumarchaeota archaeon]|nr:DoxX family protein [Nitrososphaerota archaeon]MCL5317637.1 DoxX family protein [Nitrososphaerota archaeon]